MSPGSDGPSGGKRGSALGAAFLAAIAVISFVLSLLDQPWLTAVMAVAGLLLVLAFVATWLHGFEHGSRQRRTQ